MRSLIHVLVALFLAVGAAFYIHHRLVVVGDPGYVIVGFREWALETSLFVAGVALFISFVLLYSLIRVVVQALRLPKILQRRKDEIMTRRSQETLIAGLIETAEGNYEKAEKNLIRHVADSGVPLINYLTAARAAHSRGAVEQRDEYLKLAHERSPEAELAVGLVRAELQLSNQQFEQALEGLTHLNRLAPTHATVLKMLHQAYAQMEDWEGLKRLIPSLHSNKVMMEAEIRLLETETYSALLKNAANRSDAEELATLWQGIPQHIRSSTGIQTLYYAAMIEAGAGETIEGPLRASLAKEWNEAMVVLYGCIQLPNAEDQLLKAEVWYKKHSQDAVLLRVLGKLALRADAMEKGVEYLQRSLGLEESVEAYRLLGDALLRMNDAAGAAQYFRKGLYFASNEVITQIENNPSGEAVEEPPEASRENA